MRSARVAALVMMSLLLTIGRAWGGDPQEVANRVSQQVMSPFCDGLTLHDCPSQESVELRAEVLQMARRGMSTSAIVDELVGRYGERIRGVPEPEGTGLLVWVLPGLGAAAAVATALLLARRFSSRRRLQAPQPLTADERARLDAEMSVFRSQP